MIYTFLLVLLIIDSLVVIGAILLQAGKGSGLAANFGGASSSPDAFIGIRQAGNLLTRVSWWGGGMFLFLAFVLQIMSTHTRAPRSILEKPFSTAPVQSAPAPTATPAVPLQSVPAPAAAPASPLTTAPATTPPVVPKK